MVATRPCPRKSYIILLENNLFKNCGEHSFCSLKVKIINGLLSDFSLPSRIYFSSTSLKSLRN